MTAMLEPKTTPQAAKPAGGATPADVIRKAQEAGVQVVDVRFTDLPGTWQHFSLPLKELTDELFREGIGFDGSSIRTRTRATTTSIPKKGSGTRARTAAAPTRAIGRGTRRDTSPCPPSTGSRTCARRSEERRVGKECRSRGS